MTSPQTLSEVDRRLLAGWAVACATRVWPVVEGEEGVRAELADALTRAQGFADGERTAAELIRLRMGPVKVASRVGSVAGAAAARSIGQASAVAHMGAHALGAAAYAAKAVLLSGGDVDAEIGWQMARLTARQRTALAMLPPVGCGEPGPLGAGLLCSGFLGDVIRKIQSVILG